MFLADDSVFIREGVKAMLSRQHDLQIVGEAEDYDGLVDGAETSAPNVVVSDIRMPPNFHREGIEACKLIRKRHPGTGIVILSQYDDPDYAIALLSEGAAGYAYLLKDRIAEGDQLARAIREVASGGSMLDPAVVSALINPVRRTGGLDAEDDALLEMVAEGKPIKAIAAATKSTPAPSRLGSKACSCASPKASRPAPPARSTGSSGCMRPSCRARSKASRCRACCPPASPIASGARGATPATPSSSTSPC